jgi:hypothetical protein
MQTPERNDWLTDFRKLLIELIAQAGPAIAALGNDPLFGPLLDAARKQDFHRPKQGDGTPTPPLPPAEPFDSLGDSLPPVDDSSLPTPDQLLGAVLPDLPQLPLPMAGEQSGQLDGFQIPSGCFGPDGASDTPSEDDSPADSTAAADETSTDSTASPGDWCGTPSLPAMGSSDGLMVVLAALAGIMATFLQQAGPGGAIPGISGSMPVPPIPPSDFGMPGGSFGGTPPLLPQTSASSASDSVNPPGCFGTGSATVSRGPLQARVIVELQENALAAAEARIVARMAGIARHEANLLQMQRDRQLRGLFR